MSVNTNGLPPDVVPPVDPKLVSKKDEPVYEEVRDGWRETFETISFVVFLVLMLKAFVAEAYVIPTGSMATTLLGDHMFLECPRCGLKYAVNASNGGSNLEQIQQDGGRKMLKLEGCCQNCQYVISNPAESVEGGDKVLVLKPVYDMFKPVRHDSVVFKYPLGPQKDFGAYNYIKRLWGLPGEKLAIWGGDVYLVEKVGDKEKLNIIRKAPDKMLRMRRLVNNNDLVNPTFNPALSSSWQPASAIYGTTSGITAWEPADHGKIWTSNSKNEGLQWLRYQHQFQPVKAGGVPVGFPPVDGPHLITNFMAYNHGEDQFQRSGTDWVGDLMIETEVEVQESKGQFVLQLNKGVITAEARFNLDSGKCTVVLLKNGKEISTHEAATSLNSRSKHLVRFANFDHRLTLWLGSRLIFGDGIEYSDLSDEDRGPRLADFVPASIGINQASVIVRKISLWRDIYYSRDPRTLDAFSVSAEALAIPKQEFRDLAAKGELSAIRRAAWLPFYPSVVTINNNAGAMGLPAFYPKVDARHPSDHFNADEYFMLGDNSLASQDSRDWGQVPQRMLLGQAIWVYWPFRNFASIR